MQAYNACMMLLIHSKTCYNTSLKQVESEKHYIYWVKQKISHGARQHNIISMKAPASVHVRILQHQTVNLHACITLINFLRASRLRDSRRSALIGALCTISACFTVVPESVNWHILVEKEPEDS